MKTLILCFDFMRTYMKTFGKDLNLSGGKYAVKLINLKFQFHSKHLIKFDFRKKNFILEKDTACWL